MNNDVLTAMDHNYDGSEGEDNVPEPVTPPASKYKKGDFAAFRLRIPGEDRDHRNKPKGSKGRILNLEDPRDISIRRALDAAEINREHEIRNRTHFSIRNTMLEIEIPVGATHEITNGALKGEFAVVTGSGEKGSIKVSLLGGRRNGATAFIMPADLKKL